ncbi:MAG: MerR family transcriptional regulator [bacterium]|nr:MerR family transcriptional regulator [bacterium]
MEIKLPDKLTFRRTEVIKLTKLDGRVLDYWEKDIGGFKAIVNKMGEQFYSRTDVELILKIKHWMQIERIDKSKIKKMLANQHGNFGPNAVDIKPEAKKNHSDTLKNIKNTLQEILTILNKNDKY